MFLQQNQYFQKNLSPFDNIFAQKKWPVQTKESWTSLVTVIPDERSSECETKWKLHFPSIRVLRLMASSNVQIEQELHSHFTLAIGEHSSKCETRWKLIVAYSLSLTGSLKIGDQRKTVTLELSLKSGDQGARTASFDIVGHQTSNWESKFYKRK
jgi:hypothetical protein